MVVRMRMKLMRLQGSVECCHRSSARHAPSTLHGFRGCGSKPSLLSLTSSVRLTSAPFRAEKTAAKGRTQSKAAANTTQAGSAAATETPSPAALSSADLCLLPSDPAYRAPQAGKAFHWRCQRSTHGQLCSAGRATSHLFSSAAGESCSNAALPTDSCWSSCLGGDTQGRKRTPEISCTAQRILEVPSTPFPFKSAALRDHKEE